MSDAVTARPALFAAERQQRVLSELRRHGRVEAAVLAAMLDVSTESIRKDLATLEERGLLTRVHGGAIPIRQLTFEPLLDQRIERSAEKRAIARAALAHVDPAASVLIDAGSTTAALAAVFPAGHTGLVCTNSLPIALTLAERGISDLHLFGGTVRRQTLAGVGRATLDGLATINVDVAFLGTNGISRTRGLTTPDADEALVKNRMLATAHRRILLADSTKFGLESLCQHATLRDIDVLITDAAVAPRDVEYLTAQGIEVHLAGGSG